MLIILLTKTFIGNKENRNAFEFKFNKPKLLWLKWFI